MTLRRIKAATRGHVTSEDFVDVAPYAIPKRSVAAAG